MLAVSQDNNGPVYQHKFWKKTMFLKQTGNICQHPYQKGRGNIIDYSHRYYNGDQDSEIWSNAKDFIQNVKFIDFNSEPDVLRANDEAIPILNQAIESYPEFPQPHNDWGYAYIKMGQYDIAIADFNIALKYNLPYAYHNRGIVYHATQIVRIY